MSQNAFLGLETAFLGIGSEIDASCCNSQTFWKIKFEGLPWNVLQQLELNWISIEHGLRSFVKIKHNETGEGKKCSRYLTSSESRKNHYIIELN